MRGKGLDIELLKRRWIDDYDSLIEALLENFCFDFE
jgi:hypothetical protein